MMSFQYATSGECGAQMHSEPQHCILLSLLAQRIVPLHNNKVLAQFLDCVDDIGGLQVAWLLLVNMEDVPGVLNDLQ
jgi:hypothetical protein